MGYYIETNGPKGKAKWLVDNAKAVITPAPVAGTADTIPVCVVDNGPFEAAGIAFDENELACFADRNDTRERKWLSVPRAEVIRLCPEVEYALNWP